MNKSLVLLCFLLLFTAISPVCLAQETSGTEIGGVLNQNTTWTLENSPYTITSPLLVSSSVTLTIESGVVVYLSDTYLQVDGTLVAQGTPEKPISLISTGTGLSGLLSPGTPVITFSSGSVSWNEQTGTGSIIENALITSTQGSHTIYTDHVSPKINNCTIIAQNSSWVIYLESGAATVSGCSITAGEWAVAIGVSSADSNINNAKILKNIIKNAHCGILIGDGSPIVEGNLIFNNTGTINSGSGGIRIDGHYTNPIIRKNTFFENTIGLSIWNTQSPIIENNNIFNSLEYNVYMHECATDINAASNWWGTTVLSEINQSIRDYKNDFNLGTVNFIPILTEVNLNAHSLPLMVDFSFPSESFYVYNQVDFDASACYGEYSSITSYSWNFGDGNLVTSSMTTMDHQYEESNNYQVTLTVTDEFGFKNSTTKTITILPDNTPPSTNHNYDGTWQISDFTISLSASDSESGLVDTYYRINDGPERSLSSYGQPTISSENGNNTLEFWSVDMAGNIEGVHVVSGIKLDKTIPLVENLVITPEQEIQVEQDVQVSVNVSDSVSGIDDVILSYSIDNQSTWQDVSMVLNFTSELWQATIPGQQIWTNVNYKITAYDNAGNTASTNGTSSNNYEVIPEFPTWTITPILIAITLVTIFCKRKLEQKH